jgi:hypothetical protein
MFNLIMLGVSNWDTGREAMLLERIFEYTETHISNYYKQNNILLLDQLTKLPCLFMREGRGEEIAYVGQMFRPRIVGKEVSFEYTLDTEVPSLKNKIIFANRNELDMHEEWEFSRNHWAVKDIDLYRFLLRNVRPRRQRPSVFKIAEHESIEPFLASAMMPFDASFALVFESISRAAEGAGLRCRRADNIWEHAAIIQDVVSLIDRSRIVVCDCTGRNPNVFYEAGIAHTLGRDVIIIAQNEDDIPFDLRHLRYIRYQNNIQGLYDLTTALLGRFKTILGYL